MLSFHDHPSEQIIELYALGRLAEELVPSFEEHLLICLRCQEALREEDAFSQSVMAFLDPNQDSSG